MYCNICEILVNATTKFLVNQHLSRDMINITRTINKESNLKNTKQSLVSNVNADNLNEDFLFLQIFPYKTGLIFYKLKINYVIDKKL